jgi:hypothetical protein
MTTVSPVHEKLNPLSFSIKPLVNRKVRRMFCKQGKDFYFCPPNRKEGCEY